MKALLFFSLLAAASGWPSAPVWPDAFNATTAKVNPVDTRIRWSKLYYDYPANLQRQDFFNGYPYDGRASLNCSIVFSENRIWFVFPGSRECYLDHSGIPVVSNRWLSEASYQGTTSLRGVFAEQWEVPSNGDPVSYYCRADESRVPLRSTNQKEDPGATDYFDFVVGPQEAQLFALPAYCSVSNTPPKRQCP